MINNIHCLVKTSMLLLQSATVEFLSLDSFIKYNTVLSLVMCPLWKVAHNKDWRWISSVWTWSTSDAPWMPGAVVALWPGCWTMSTLCVCDWQPAWLCTDRLSCLDFCDFGRTSVAAAFCCLVSNQWNGSELCVVGLCVCVVWSALPWGQRRWRTRTGVRSLGLRSRCPVGPEAPGRLWPRPTSWRHPWCTAPPGTGTPTCPRAQREMEGYPLWRSGHYICQHSERNRGP